MDLSQRNLDGNSNLDSTYYPFFIIGVMLADLESMPSKPLNTLRCWNRPNAAIQDMILLFFAISFGGNFGSYFPNSCTYINSGLCDFWHVVTLN
jgi:hypothetical protein